MAMAEKFQTLSPIDGSLLLERSYANPKEVDLCLQRAKAAQNGWRAQKMDDRLSLLRAFVTSFTKNRPDRALEISKQMGRPIRYAGGEIGGFAGRAETMLGMAQRCLADVEMAPQAGLTRFIRREPLGVVLVLAPWNYPYLTAVNAIVPAMAAGNTVILKHSEQTPLCAERLADAADEAGIPQGVFQIIHCTHRQVADMVRDDRVDFVAFTGSVEGGRAVRKAGGSRFVGMGFELGGKDPAYVRSDADFEKSVENLVDGAFFNSGQSCCGIERIYVAQNLYTDFIDAFSSAVRGYKLGNPLDEATTLGPMVRHSNADTVRRQMARAISAGAKGLVEPSLFPADGSNDAYLAPQVLVNVDHSMEIMKEETFGPVVGIMPVRDDEEALSLMNDSQYGLTASIWTEDEEAALRIGNGLETGTVFMNRCDYLDPELAWVGVKNSGRGCTLSQIGYEQLTRPKSFHLRRWT
jgi:acyl-CoA reductase-like NAD-dependent aldehyde dehydrogenase